MRYLIFFFILSACSGLKMKRPPEKLYKQLKENNLFGSWISDDAALNISCSGSFYFEELNGDQVVYKDSGGEIVKLDTKKGKIFVSNLLGRKTYHYEFINKDDLSFQVSKYSASIKFDRTKVLDCDKEPKNMTDAFQDMEKQMLKPENQP